MSLSAVVCMRCLLDLWNRMLSWVITVICNCSVLQWLLMFYIIAICLQTGLYLDIIRYEFVSCSSKRHFWSCNREVAVMFLPGNAMAVSSIVIRLIPGAWFTFQSKADFWNKLSDLWLCIHFIVPFYHMRNSFFPLSGACWTFPLTEVRRALLWTCYAVWVNLTHAS